MESKIIKSDFRGLNNFVKSLSDGRVVKVGIMGSKVSRDATGDRMKAGGHKVKKGTTSKLTNAEMGAIHEFGSITKKIPPRSFLRMPIHQKADEIIQQAKGGVTSLVTTGNKETILKRIGIACENAIQMAFASAGFGSWKPLKAATIKAKGSSRPLIDTAQLRRSIASTVGTPS